MYSCLLRRTIFILTFFLAATVTFTGCSNSSGGSSALLALLGGGGDKLSVPQNVTASNGSFTDRVTVSWDAVTDATYYQVYRCDTEDGTYELISGNETATTFDDTDTLVPDTNYYYKVKAFNGTTESDFSDFATGKLGLEPLDTPLNVTATDGTQVGKVTVTWDAVTGATLYRVYRSTSSGGTYSLISGDETVTSYEDTTATPAVDYYYKVQAFNATQSSLKSDYSLGMAMLAAPGNVNATNGTYGDRIDISWDAVTGADHYVVYRSTSSGSGFAAVSGDLTGTSYSDTSGTPGTNYYYRVKAVTGDVESALSGYSLGMISLAAPGGVTASDGTYTDHVEIDWSSVTGADHYVVYRSTSTDSGFSAVSGSLTGTTFSDTTGTPGTDYYYRVKAFNGTNESALSAYALGSIALTPPPAAPTNPSATQNTYTDKVTVSWDSVTGADHYNVFRADSSGGPYTTQIGGDITGTSVNDTTVVAGTHYFYKIKAVNGNGSSEFSAAAEGWAQLVILPLDAPTNVSASDRTSTTTVTVTWNAVTDADYYRVYRALKSDGDYVQIGGDIYTTSYSDTTPFEDLAYYYKVKAFDAVRGESPFSSYDAGRCDLTRLEYLLRFNLNYEYYMTKLANTTDFPPGGLGTYDWTVYGEISGNSAVHIVASLSTMKAISTFTHNAYNDLGMTLSGTETDSVNFSGNGTHTGTMTTGGTYTGTVVENLTVTSKVRSGGTFTVTYGGSSETINFSSTWAPGQMLSVPPHVSTTQGTDAAKVVVSWAPVYGATAYRVYRATTSGGTYSQIGSDVAGSAVAPDGTIYSYNDSSGTSGTHYFYKVRAINLSVNNDQNGDQTHQSPAEDLMSGYSSYAEGWR